MLRLLSIHVWFAKLVMLLFCAELPRGISPTSSLRERGADVFLVSPKDGAVVLPGTRVPVTYQVRYRYHIVANRLNLSFNRSFHSANQFWCVFR